MNKGHSLTLPLRLAKEVLLKLEEAALNVPELRKEIGAIAPSIGPLQSLVAGGSALEKIREVRILGNGQLGPREVTGGCVYGCRSETSRVLANLYGQIQERHDDSDATDEVSEISKVFERHASHLPSDRAAASLH